MSERNAQRIVADLCSVDLARICGEELQHTRGRPIKNVSACLETKKMLQTSPWFGHFFFSNFRIENKGQFMSCVLFEEIIHSEGCDYLLEIFKKKYCIFLTTLIIIRIYNENVGI
ncbi:hypothetical protein OL548_26580 [Lysinibacillus sp. MHQ-1]|nr:hypothetical protein OL548_26580 [Lysinibacillus sp. MHQ-1]